MANIHSKQSYQCYERYFMYYIHDFVFLKIIEFIFNKSLNQKKDSINGQKKK